MIKWFYYWDEWRKAYWGLIDQHPELFAFLHRLYVFQHRQESGQLNKDEALFRRGTVLSSVRTRLKGLMARRTEQVPVVDKSMEPKLEDRPLQVDVLFYSHSNRDTCLGVGEKLLEKIREKQPDVKAGFYQNSARRAVFSDRHLGFPVFSLRMKFSLRGLVRFLLLLPVVYWHGLKSRAVSKFIFRHPLITTINLLKITMLSACAERMLDRISPKMIISCNEQGGADASILFALARKRRIHTIQYLHCPPTRQFVPFICDEYWSWSELTTRMLLGEAQDSRVINMGSLEHENRAEVLTPGNKTLPEEKRVLLLSQMGMDEAWGIHAVADGMKKFVEGVRLYPGAVKVRVREHPNAKAAEREMLERFMRETAFEVTIKAIPLAQDIAWATHIYSISSTGILSALLDGKPAYLLWNPELDEVYGRCFLPDRNIVNSSTDFVESLNRFLPPDYAALILQQVLGPLGAMDRAVERVCRLVSAC